MNGKLHVHHSGNGEVANPWADDLLVTFYNDAGITIGCPEGKIGTLAFSDQNKADRNQLRAYSTVRDSRAIGMHHFANQADTDVPSFSVTDGQVGINNAEPSFSLDLNGDLGFSVSVGGAISTSINVPSDTSFFTCDPQGGGAGDTAYLPAVASSSGKIIRILNISGSNAVTIKTISNGSFAGGAGGSLSLAAEKFVTCICDGNSWYPNA